MRVHLRMILLCFGVFVMAMPFTAYAVKYTTQSEEKNTLPAGQKEVPMRERCTKNHLQMIKKFDRISVKYIKEYLEADETRKEVKSKKDQDKYLKNMKKASFFFKSKKYREMKEVYAICGKEIPRPQYAPAFWTPNQEMVDAEIF